MEGHRLKTSTEELFWSKVDIGWTDQCWLWTGAVSSNGYGNFNTGYRRGIGSLPHRISYEMLVGKIPDGAVIDHMCRVRLCTNPSHLEPVTQQQNVIREREANGPDRLIRNQNSDKEFCVNGHSDWLHAHGRRVCIPCRKNSWTKANAKRRNG